MTADMYRWRRLGNVLVEAGLLNESDLADVLLEQKRTGDLLGKIVVARGLVSPAAVANALAEQYGGFLRSEHGFGTGLTAAVAAASESDVPDEPPVSAPAVAHLVFVPAPDGYRLLERDGHAPNVGDQLELADAGDSRFVVTKVAASPLPADARRCAYLDVVAEDPGSDPEGVRPQQFA